MSTSRRKPSRASNRRNGGGVALSSRSSRTSKRDDSGKSFSASARGAKRSARKETENVSSRVSQEPKRGSSRSSSRRTKKSTDNRQNGRAAGRSSKRESNRKNSSTARNRRDTRTDSPKRSSRAGSSVETSARRRGGSRNGSGGGGMNEFYLYGGIGMGVFGLMLIAYAVNHKMSKKSTASVPATQQVAASSVDAPYVAPNATPFNSPAEAASALNRAQDLVRMAQEESGTARNNHYKEAKHLCERILMTKSASTYHEKAGKLLYNSSKMQTY